MACKVLLFEYRDLEKPFFEKNKSDNYEIKFFKEQLNEKFLVNLEQSDFYETNVISIYKFSKVTSKILSEFKNLRAIAIRARDYKHVDLQMCIDKNIAVINVENADSESEYNILQSSFRSLTGVLCGQRENRIV